MADQDAVQARKDAAAADASQNYGAGVDGDGPSAADVAAEESFPPDDFRPGPADHGADPDPVTGTTSNATGAKQAAENEDRDPVG
jgi:hypothetical protein